MPNYNIPFSPPDITEAEIAEVADTLRSGWITTGPKTKNWSVACLNTHRHLRLSASTLRLPPLS